MCFQLTQARSTLWVWSSAWNTRRSTTRQSSFRYGTQLDRRDSSQWLGATLEGPSVSLLSTISLSKSRGRPLRCWMKHHSQTLWVDLIWFLSCSPDSFEKVRSWLSEVRQGARSEATYFIFGNKNDLEDKGQRQVNLMDGAKFAQENECLFCEGSAKTGQGVE